MANLLEGKRGLVIGVANERSIAWGIANVLAKHGAELAITYQTKAFEKRVRPLASVVDARKSRVLHVKESLRGVPIRGHRAPELWLLCLLRSQRLGQH